MKFSTKIFVSTIIPIILTFSVGGYILISSLFDSALERELNAAEKEHRLLCFSLETAMSTMSYELDSQIAIRENLIKVADALQGDGSNEGVKIRISNENTHAIYEPVNFKLDYKLLSYITEDKDGYTIQKLEDNYYIQYASKLDLPGTVIYFESFKNISYIFTSRTFQYDIYKNLIIALVVIDGIIILIIAMWLTWPIKKLSKTTRKIAGGQFSERVDVKSRDEVGKLAVDFNAMADILEKKISDLEDAAKRQEDFIASFAHELKTPLTSVIGYADMLRSKELPKEKSFIAANYIFKEGKRLESLSLKLLELIVIKRGRIEKDKTNIGSLLKETAAFMELVLLDADITLTIDVEEAILDLEADLIKTLIFNLLDNARKATQETGQIVLKGKQKESAYCIAISDTGKGIPEDEMNRITEAFYMVDKSRAREEGGAGLGLSICMEIVELHEGKMSFSSKLGAGTKVTIILPLPKGEEE